MYKHNIEARPRYHFWRGKETNTTNSEVREKTNKMQQLDVYF